MLPLVNAGGDHDHDYLGDGITERLIDTLSQLPKLHVMARSTVFRFSGREIDPLVAGRELDVRAVLTGRLTKAGDVLRVQAELVDVATGFRLWGARYERPMRDLLAIEEEISREICEHLRFKLSAPERRKVAKQHTKNAEAYQLYLKGRFSWNKWTPDGMRSAIRSYESAIELDPTYALAWGGIADAFGVLGNIKAVPPAEAFPQAKSAALRALELDPNLAEAHASLGFVRRFFDWEWSSAEREFQDAVRLSPGYATGHRWYGQLLSGMGRHEEAIAEVRRALELDPLSVIIHTAVGDVLFYARRYDDAIDTYRKALELDPDFLAGHSDLARALEYSGRIDEAIRTLREGRRARREHGRGSVDRTCERLRRRGTPARGSRRSREAEKAARPAIRLALGTRVDLCASRRNRICPRMARARVRRARFHARLAQGSSPLRRAQGPAALYRDPEEDGPGLSLPR